MRASRVGLVMVLAEINDQIFLRDWGCNHTFFLRDPICLSRLVLYVVYKHKG
jgi:hypothetical protein